MLPECPFLLNCPGKLGIAVENGLGMGGLWLLLPFRRDRRWRSCRFGSWRIGVVLHIMRHLLTRRLAHFDDPVTGGQQGTGQAGAVAAGSPNCP